MLPEIRDCERVDALRLRTPFYMLASGVALLLISLIYRSSSSALFVLFLLVGVSGILEALANFLLLFGSMSAGSRWKHSSTGVEFWPLWSGTSGKYISCLVMTMSALVPGAIVISTRFTDTGSLKVLLYSIIFGAIAATMWADLPFNRPRRPAIEMDSEGIYFWRYGSHSTYIAWDVSPAVVGCKSLKGTPRALIESGNGPSYVSISSLPIGYDQLRKVLFFYGARPERRHELASQRGLERVRELMYASLNEVEAGLARERTQSTNRPDPSPPPFRQRSSRPPASRSAAEPPSSAGNGGDATSVE